LIEPPNIVSFVSALLNMCGKSGRGHFVVLTHSNCGGFFCCFWSSSFTT
jgi:hypothetical protein